MFRVAGIAAFVFVALAPVAEAQVVYSDVFDGGGSGANWTTSVAPGTAAAGADSNFAFDYSTVGIPSAPNSTGGSTVGARFRVNRTGTGIFSGISASPNGQSFLGDYTLRFDLWQNFNGPFPVGGSGSTQASGGGIGANTATAQFPGGTIDGVMFAATGDANSANDYRAYVNSGSPLADTSGTYAAGNVAGVTNASHPYYAANLFGSVTAPAAQVALFPGQTGTTGAGAVGMEWHTWTISKLGNVVSWQLRNRNGIDVFIASTDVSAQPFGADNNIFLAHFDTNLTSSTDPNSDSMLIAVFDNIQVTQIPEPTSLVLLGFAASGVELARRRRKPQTLAAN